MINMKLSHVSGRGLFFTDKGEPTPLWGVTWEKVKSLEVFSFQSNKQITRLRHSFLG